MPAQSQKRTVGSVLNKLIQRVNTDTRRLRILEQENVIIKTRIETEEKNSLSERKHAQKNFLELEKKITKIEDNLAMIEKTMKDIINEIKKLATNTKLKELENLIDIYSPLKSEFITREEAQHLIDEKLGGSR